MSIGEVLAEARRQAGLTVTQVSHRTRIRETVITAIEGDDYAACGGHVYAPGYIRSIARAVGTDAEPLIRQYGSRGLRPLANDEDVITQPIPPVPMDLRHEPAGPVAPGPMGKHLLAWAVMLGVAAGAVIGLAGYFFASPGHSIAPSAGTRGATPDDAGSAGHAAPASPAATNGTRAASAGTAITPAARPHILSPAGAAAFGFSGGPGDNSVRARLAIDRNPATAWTTDWYTTAKFGNLYPGTGLLLDMGRPVTITAVRITLSDAPGAALQLRVGSEPVLASLRPVSHVTNASGVVRLRLSRPAHGRYVLIWFTRLPPDPAGTFQESVYGVQLKGRA